jgi:hypothetical protein
VEQSRRYLGMQEDLERCQVKARVNDRNEALDVDLNGLS